MSLGGHRIDTHPPRTPQVASINQIFGSMIRAKFPPADPARIPEVWDFSESLVDITIDIWNRVMAKMLPTPAKFHYIFNLRDLSRVFQVPPPAPSAATSNVRTPPRATRHRARRRALRSPPLLCRACSLPTFVRRSRASWS